MSARVTLHLLFTGIGMHRIAEHTLKSFLLNEKLHQQQEGEMCKRLSIGLRLLSHDLLDMQNSLIILDTSLQ